MHVDRDRNDGARFGEGRLRPRIEPQSALRYLRNRNGHRVAPAAYGKVAFDARPRRARHQRDVDDAARGYQRKRDCNAVLRIAVAANHRRRTVGAHRPAQHAPAGRKFERSADVARGDPALVGNANA